jgi:hypothetical protein
MLLKVILDDQVITLNVPDVIVRGGEDFYARMDRDMDGGWQMGREWVPSPSTEQRCQIAANKLVTAIENENEQLGRLMAGYILARLPDVEAVEIDSAGEIQDVRFTLGAAASRQRDAAPAAAAAPASRLAALEQAGREVTKPFKVGRQYRFAVLNRATGLWEDSPAIGTEAEAEAQRELAVKRRFDELVGGH